MVRMISIGNGVGSYSEQDSILNTSPALIIGIGGTLQSFGMWVRMAGVGSPTIFVAMDTTPVNLLTLSGTIGSNFTLTGNDANVTPTTFSITGGAWVDGTWNFLLVRNVSASLRYFDTIADSGIITQTSDATLLTYVSATVSWQIGPPNGSTTNGGIGTFDIGEFWYTDQDIVNGGGPMDPGTLRQLAWYGPFSVFDIGKKIVEWRSWRTGTVADGSRNETFWRPDKGPQKWIEGTTTASAVKRGLLVPLPPTYIRPLQTEPIIPI